MSIADRYDVDDVILLSGTFKNDADALADPTEAELTLLLPDQSESVYRWPVPGVGEGSMSHDGTGLLSVLYQAEMAGVVHWRWRGIGSVTGSDEDFAIIKASAFD